MNPKFKKLALAASIGAGLGAAAVPAQAVIIGAPGEALLVPLVMHGGDVEDASNTYIKVTVPSTVGFDTVPNYYTAPNTSPTNPGPTLFPTDADLVPGNTIHWYWFDKKSVHQLDRKEPVTADDVVWIDWLKASAGRRAGEEGYMVIGTEAARTGAAADFSMYGEAWFEIYEGTVTGSMIPIPVLPMSDGPDGGSDTMPTREDNVKYQTPGIPRAVSPLISGMRTNRSDGDMNDTTVFNLSLGDRNFPSVHVVWLDTNLNDFADLNGGLDLPIEVFDSQELSCSDAIDVPWELNVIEIDALGDLYPSDDWKDLCIPDGSYPLTQQNEGFVTYYIPEYIDNDVDAPESAGVAFSISLDWDADSALRYTSSVAQERGTYK